MTQLGILPDVEDYVQNGLLTIINEKIIAKQKAQLNARQLTEMFFSRASKALKKSSAKRVVVINNSDALLERGDHAKQIEFEQAINFKFGENRNSKENVEAICCYSTAIVQKLGLKHLFPLVNAHTSIIDKEGWKYNHWHPSTVMEIISKGIEKCLDPLTADLILKTFKLVYKMDEKSLVSNPAIFEVTLRKILGSNAADTVLASITEETKRQIMF